MWYFFLSMALAKEITVGDGASYRTIQDAVNRASNGDTISLQNAKFVECFNTKGKSIIITSKVGTIIDGQGKCPFVVNTDGGGAVRLENMIVRNSGKGGISAKNPKLQLLLKKVTIEQTGSIGSKASGLFAASSKITIRDSRFRANQAEKGGAIFLNKGATVEIHDSMFSDNSAQIGGAINLYDKSKLTMTNTRFVGNQARSGGLGGAIAIRRGSSVKGQKLRFQNNKAKAKGGAIYMQESSTTGECSLELSGSSFQGNSSFFGSGAGGVIYVRNKANVAIKNTRFMQNKAATQGGVLFFYDVANKVVIDGCTFQGNSAHTAAGGAIYASSRSEKLKAKLQISNTTFSKNHAALYGGAISIGDKLHSSGELELNRVTFQQNKCASSRSGAGGAIYINSDGSSKVAMKNSKFKANQAELSGGAVYIHGAGQVTVSDTTFDNNLAKGAANVLDRYGGALMVTSANTLSLSKNRFCGNEIAHQGNNAPKSYGGAFYGQEIKDAQLIENVFVNNISEQQGGAIAGDRVGFTVRNNTLAGNQAKQGGAIWLLNSPAKVLNNILSNTVFGGAVWSQGTSPSIQNNAWSANNGGHVTGSSFALGKAGNVDVVPNFRSYSSQSKCSRFDVRLRSDSTLAAPGKPKRGAF